MSKRKRRPTALETALRSGSTALETALRSGSEAAAEILSLRTQLAEAREAALEEAAVEAASWQGLKGRAVADKIRALKGQKQKIPVPTITTGSNGCVCPAGAEQTCNSPFCGRRSRPYEIT